MTTGNVYARPPANTPSTPRSMEESGEAHDYLVCGLCYRNFPLSSIVSFMQHKKLDCDDVQMYPNQVENSRILLQCQTCSQRFFNPWTLLQHAQQDHSLSIYLNVAGLYESVTNSDDGGNASQPFGIVQSALTFSRNSEEQAPSIHTLESKTSSTDRSSSVRDGRRTFSENSDSYVLDDCQQNLESFERGQESSSENEAAEDRDGAVKQAAAKSTILKQKGKLQKCCTAVVPKKRKRHMETKHILTHDKLRLEGSTIYIDVASTSDAFHGDPSPTTEEHHHEKGHRSAFSASEMSTRSAVPTQYNPTRKTSSIIIQPGSTFSIPLPYMPRASTIPLSVHAPRPVPLRVACTGATCPPGADGLSSYTTPNLVCSADQSVLNFSLHDKQQSRNQLDYGSLYRPVIGHSGLTDREHSGERLSAFHNPKFPAPTQSSSHQANHDREDCTPTVTVTESRNRSHITHMQDKQKKKRRYPTSRPFKCDQCSQAFNQRIHLRKHLSKHTGIKPFKCEQCDYSTVERSHLKVHIRVHTGEKPFKCTYCEYATAQNSTLKIHLKRHHATNDGNTCSVCNRKFSEQDSLAVHMTQHGYSQQAGNQAHQNFSDQTENSESFASD